MTILDRAKTTVGKATVTSAQFSTGQVTSADGTIIGYRQTGTGPGLVIMHGVLRSSRHYERLARTLADKFTVYIPDRADLSERNIASAKNARTLQPSCERRALAGFLDITAEGYLLWRLRFSCPLTD